MKPVRYYPLIKNLDAIIAGGIGFIIIQFFGRHSGIGISPDSVTNLSVARNLHSAGSFRDFNQSPLVVFPWFYPLFLSAKMFLTRQDVLPGMIVINGFLLWLLIILSGLIMNRFSNTSRVYKWIILSC